MRTCEQNAYDRKEKKTRKVRDKKDKGRRGWIYSSPLDLPKRKKNLGSLARTKEKLAQIQTINKPNKEKKKEKLTILHERVDDLTTKKKAAKNQKLDCLEVVVVEFQEEVSI